MPTITPHFKFHCYLSLCLSSHLCTHTQTLTHTHTHTLTHSLTHTEDMNPSHTPFEIFYSVTILCTAQQMYFLMWLGLAWHVLTRLFSDTKHWSQLINPNCPDNQQTRNMVSFGVRNSIASYLSLAETAGSNSTSNRKKKSKSVYVMSDTCNTLNEEDYE